MTGLEGSQSQQSRRGAVGERRLKHVEVISTAEYGASQQVQIWT